MTFRQPDKAAEFIAIPSSTMHIFQTRKFRLGSS